jgi:hypothetical protein
MEGVRNAGEVLAKGEKRYSSKDTLYTEVFILEFVCKFAPVLPRVETVCR